MSCTRQGLMTYTREAETYIFMKYIFMKMIVLRMIMEPPVARDYTV